MISCDHYSHRISEFLGFREIELMSRMENIESTKTHHMMKVIFMCIFDAIFRIREAEIGERHNTKRSQIEKKCCLCTQKVHNFKKTFDNR